VRRPSTPRPAVRPSPHRSHAVARLILQSGDGTARQPKGHTWSFTQRWWQAHDSVVRWCAAGTGHTGYSRIAPTRTMDVWPSSYKDGHGGGCHPNPGACHMVGTNTLSWPPYNDHRAHLLSTGRSGDHAKPRAQRGHSDDVEDGGSMCLCAVRCAVSFFSIDFTLTPRRTRVARVPNLSRLPHTHWTLGTLRLNNVA